jgi:hypothetical protein
MSLRVWPGWWLVFLSFLFVGKLCPASRAAPEVHPFGLLPELPSGSAGLRHVWLGDVPLGDMPIAARGMHEGHPFSVGGRTLRATWDNESSGQGIGRLSLLYSHGSLPGGMLPSRKELVILTTSVLAARSVLLPRFIDLREAEGYAVVVATEVEWDQPVGFGADTRQDRIRHWLARNFASDPGAFLLLIGNPDPSLGEVPMQEVHPIAEYVRSYPDWLAEEMDPVLTDWYYADLDGNWDCDGDGWLAEYPDDAGEGCTDFGPELFVGRIPVYGSDAEALDTLLERAIARDLESDKTYRERVLFPAALFSVRGAPSPLGGAYGENSDGACITDAAWRDLPEGFSATRLYEEEGLVTSSYAHEEALDRDAVVERWSEGRGTVLWCGHGSSDGVFRMVWNDDADGDGRASESELSYPAYMDTQSATELEDTQGAFTWHVSCDNGFPEVERNLGTVLLYGGAAGTCTASRPSVGATSSWGEPWSPDPTAASGADCGYYFTQKVLQGATSGEALAFTKYAMTGDGWDYGSFDYTGYAWLTWLEYNLYGDPTRSLELCHGSEDCDDGSPCDGSESCQGGFCVHDALIDCSLLDDACTVGNCDDATGSCGAVARADGATCDDGLWCTEFDACSASTCTGLPRDCGERPGYTSWCSEEEQSCASEKDASDGSDEVPADEDAGCASVHTTRGRSLTLLGLLFILGRRRSGKRPRC